jgi:hypothetical protein
MTEPAPETSKPKRGPKPTVVIVDEVPDFFEAHNPQHLSTAREQLMRQWPSQEWEKR